MSLSLFAFMVGCVLGAVTASRSTRELGGFETVDVPPRVFKYRLAGDFNLAGRPVDAPLLEKRRSVPLRIMRRQVAGAQYQLCVQDGSCAARPSPSDADANLPAVLVSWQDATTFAAWLSARTGETWRLPTDEEWVFAAGSRFHDDALLIGPSSEPSARWLARFEREAERAPLGERLRPIGAFGENEHGLVDLSGNVWEWTDTCFIRQSIDARGAPTSRPIVNCGVKVVEGEHRTYVTDFVRDARAGGCAVGAPPSNLGFRLVLASGDAPQFLSLLRARLSAFLRSAASTAAPLDGAPKRSAALQKARR